ncbi:hypothetical protein DF122_12325 [Burkholderia pseudomallei]|nr:hypothetical protein CXQ84_25825 [Burkholderia pseudomallei]AYE31049.1 hypothetical protein CNX72_27940 [Burkholderia pseudomallei]NRD87381.1 hypothetical protein [Burkholderia pseudomallei]NRE34176.1 hypothetical protein [Burkholderia pseudomallei]NRE51896.1 hypothetical protein [Burkholderia pseudomallei]
MPRNVAQREAHAPRSRRRSTCFRFAEPAVRALFPDVPVRRPARSEGVWRRPDNSTPPPLARAREPPRCGAGLPNRWLSLPRASISKPRSSSD